MQRSSPEPNNEVQSPFDWLRSTWELLLQFRFLALFLAIVGILVLIPTFERLGATHAAVARFADLTVFAVLYAVIVMCIPGRSHLRILVRLLGVVSFLAVVVDVFVVSGSESVVPRTVLGGLLMAYMLWVLIAFVLFSKKVSPDTIAASLCAYLLMGLVWAEVYGIMLFLRPDALSFPEELTSVAEVRVGGPGSTSIIYFSFVTLTTLGYGDITPVDPLLMILSVLEAALGQIYLTVLVARLVGLHIARESS